MGRGGLLNSENFGISQKTLRIILNWIIRNVIKEGRSELK
jgi:hypothetical protein